jgi:biofilm PGA synthesis lipoprotein PgaB
MIKKGIIIIGLFMILISVGVVFSYAKEDQPFKINLLTQNAKPTLGYGIMVKGEDDSKKDNYYISIDLSKEMSLSESSSKIIKENKDKSIQLMCTIDETKNIDQNVSEIVSVIKDLPSENQKIMLSLIPSENMTDQDYSSIYTQVKDKLKSEKEKKIDLVWYPNTKESIASIPTDINWIGVTVKTPKDMAMLEDLYKKFPKSAIVVNEGIADAYMNDIKNGIDAINHLYYTAAYKYPNIKMIYNTSIEMGTNEKYQRNYEELLKEPWITALKLKESETRINPYIELEDYMQLSGNTSIILETQLDEQIGYVEYKWNNGNLTQNIRKPYLLTIDTNELHNGINRLSVIRYDNKGVIIDKRKVDVKVNNSNVSKRAMRRGTQYHISQKTTYKKPYIPVLMYHKFDYNVDPNEHSMFVSASRFEDQIKEMVNEGYTPITLYDLKRYLDGDGGLPQKPVIITADDGYMNNYTIAYPILKKYNAQATFFITTEFIGTKTASDHFTWEQAREMEESGLIDIQSHTHSHALLNQLREQEIKYQVSMSMGLIEQNLGKRDVKVFSYPEFRDSSKTRKILKTLGIDLQITDLANRRSKTTDENVQRIHVTNDLSGKELVAKIRHLTE